MQKSSTQLEKIKLVGISTRTGYATECDPKTGKIGPTVERYFQEGISEKIPNRKSPGKIYCAYGEYDGDYTGNYTYFIGEEVFELFEIPEELQSLTIPAQSYMKLTTDPGPMPAVCIEAWQKIWEMNSDDLSGKRAYKVDFEIYDERAKDPQETVLDIYVGIIPG